MYFLFILPYVATKFPGGVAKEELNQFILTDKTAILILILSAFPAHLLTLGIIWAVATRFGKRPFWRTLGWSRGSGFGFWKSAGLATLLYLIGILLIFLFGQQQTQLDQVLESSREAAIATALLSVVTAPLVEEMVYRGVLYSALQRAIGRQWAIIGVMVLFTAVHVPQYWPNFGVIGAVGLLSLSLTLVRAYTGRLLPCFIMHLIFNGIQSALIIFEPYLRQLITNEQKAAAIMTFSRTVRSIF
jgi:membrane protease YdiL (CAAX protease family)